MNYIKYHQALEHRKAELATEGPRDASQIRIVTTPRELVEAGQQYLREQKQAAGLVDKSDAATMAESRS